MRYVALVLLAACGTGERFGPPQTVIGRGAAHPTVAVDGGGAVYVAWVQMEADSTSNAYVARAPRDGPFGPPARVNDRPGEVMGATQNPAQVVAGSDGTIYVAWVSDRAPAGSPQADINIRFARSTDAGRTFLPSVTLDVGDGRRWPANLYYDVAASPDGALYVSWLDLHYFTDTLAARAVQHVPDSIPVPESRVDLRVARSTDGARTFATAVTLDGASCICCRTAIAAGPDGNPRVLWRHVFPGNVRDFYAAASRDRGVTFGEPVRVHEDGWVLNGCPDIGPDLVVDEHAAVHAAWYTGAPGRPGLWYAVSRDGGATFGPPVAVLTDSYVPPSEVQLATLGGSTWLVWEDRRRAPGEIRFAPSGERRSRSLGQGAYPNVAAAGGRLAVSWEAKGAVYVRVAEVGVGHP